MNRVFGGGRIRRFWPNDNEVNPTPPGEIFLILTEASQNLDTEAGEHLELEEGP